jgi:hypothetical protein
METLKQIQLPVLNTAPHQQQQRTKEERSEVERSEAERITEENQTFRNELASVNPDGTRKWVYAQKPEGRFSNARSIVSLVLLAFFFVAPFVRIQGNPLVLFNIVERKFILFGIVFWTQDFYLLVLTMITAIVSIAVFTAIWGRIFCGWACPQTIFLEQVFRRIEYLIEGNARERIALDKTPWTMNKILRKVGKHSIYLILAWIVSNLFLSYIIGTEALFTIITDNPQHHIGGLIAMTVFSGLYYGLWRVRTGGFSRHLSMLIPSPLPTITNVENLGENLLKLIKSTLLPMFAVIVLIATNAYTFAQQGLIFVMAFSWSA